MAQFNSTIITTKGHALIAKIVAATASPTFSKMNVSDYTYPPGTDFAALTAMTSVKQTALVASVSKLNAANVKVSAVLTNAGVAAGYYLRAIGLYAIDPQEGEILFSITTAVTADYIPPDTGISATSVTLDLITVVSNADNVSIAVDPNAVATVAQLNAIPQKSFYADIEAYHGNTKLIDDFQDASLWTVGGAVQSADTTNVKIGKQSLKILENDNVLNQLFTSKSNLSLDLTKLNNGELSDDNDYINCVFYISDVSLLDYVAFAFGADSSYQPTANKYKQTDAVNLVTGWNFLKIKKSAFGTAGTATWNNIQSIRIIWRSKDNAINAYVSLQLIQLVKKDPAADYPNPFQKMGVRDLEILSTAQFFVGKEFGKLAIKNIGASGVTVFPALKGSVGFKDFISRMKIFLSTSGVSYGSGWHVNDSNRLYCYVEANTLKLVKQENNIYTTISSGAAFTVGDSIELILSKKGSKVRVIAFKNGDYSNPTHLEMSHSLDGSIGYFITGVKYDIGTLEISMSEIAYAHHADIADIAKSLVEQPKVRVYNTASQSIANVTTTTLTFSIARYDNRGHFDLSNPSRITIRENGLYDIDATALFPSNATGFRGLAIWVNGTIPIAQQQCPAVSVSPTVLNVGTKYQLKAGDYLEMRVIQSSGGALDVTYNLGYSPEFSIAKIG